MGCQSGCLLCIALHLRLPALRSHGNAPAMFLQSLIHIWCCRCRCVMLLDLLSISPSSLLPLRKYGCKVPLTDQIARVRCLHRNFGFPAFRCIGHTKVSAIPSRETRCSPLSGDCTHLPNANVSEYPKFVEICWNSRV